ncbi:MAG: hypothetical protein IANPNBLG_01968 [Bryobacteraceae bacterium]|nr:hypothetical protein [Bryobacteraceae bacterium]
MTPPGNEEMFACDWSMPRSDSFAPALCRVPAAGGSHFGGALYSDFLAQGLSHFFPAARLEADGRRAVARADLWCDCKAGRMRRDRVLLEWLGQGYSLRRARRPFTENERRLIHAIGRVLTARYQALFNPDIAARNFHLFHGLPEDRYVSAFLDPAPYENLETLAEQQDRAADAIEVLRSSALTTHENRRVSTGALLLGRSSPGQEAGGDGLRYSSALTSIRSFPRLCDGIHTVALVNAKGRWIDIADLDEWAAGQDSPLLPGPSAYRPHCRATLGNENLCLVLTPNGEIKAFSGGVQTFSFLNGCWRLTDFEWKYRRWAEAIGNSDLAKLVLQVAFDLADARRGGLFAILDDSASAVRLVSPADLLAHEEYETAGTWRAGSKRSLYYLLNGKRTADLSPAVLRPLATIDGGVVFDRGGRLLAFGAILRHNESEAGSNRAAQGGGRTMAAVAASHYGWALKISEDGIISFFEKGNWVWDV